jgi:sigma-E factor negative regulatory protein RseA
MNEELDSQLSAMFDDELPAPQCELLARRLARDEALKARWGRYAAIGAAIRMERGVDLGGNLARRVSAMLAAEPSLLAGPRERAGSRLASPMHGLWQPVAGAAVAAGVATVAIFLLRAGSPDAPLLSQVALQGPLGEPATIIARPAALTGPSASSAAPPDSYVVPPQAQSRSFAPPIELADFVVAHSEFSMPLLSRSAISALVAAESQADSGDSADASSDSASASSDGDKSDNSDPGTSDASPPRAH